MTAPRLLARAKTYLVTRRCTQRQFLLRPSAETNRAFLYCLAIAAARTGVEIHAVVQMSNHWHGVLTDPEARLPKFLHIFHRLLAKAMNALLGRRENFWASGHTNVVALETADEVIDKLVYVITNPVNAGLVESPAAWPGVITAGLAERHAAKRPRTYFREQGSLPEEAELACTIPPALRQRERGELVGRLHALVAESIRRAKDALRTAGRAFLGPRRVRATPVTQAAVAPEPLVSRKPTVAARTAAVASAAIARLRDFRRAYRAAFACWREGDRSVAFPDGTYLMRVLHGACCPPAPAS